MINKDKKNKIRRLLARISPDDKPDLLFDELKEQLKEVESKIKPTDLSGLIQKINTAFNSLRDSVDKKINDLSKEDNTEALKKEVEHKIEKLKDLIPEPVEVKDFTKDFSGLAKRLEELEKDFRTRLGHSHGGNANRNILVNGNPSTLGKYTDLNIKPGSNITLTYTSNNNLKTTDLTIAAEGGSGTARLVESTTVSSTLGAVASTDYVVIANAGVALTLPTAVGNANVYNVINAAASSVLVATTGGQTVNEQANLILNTQYVSIHLISDNANWRIT